MLLLLISVREKYRVNIEWERHRFALYTHTHVGKVLIVKDNGQESRVSLTGALTLCSATVWKCTWKYVYMTVYWNGNVGPRRR